MSDRRKFLSNIVLGATAVPFIGKITEANESEVEEFGKPNLILGRRQELFSEISLTLRAYCGVCDKNIHKLLMKQNNQESRYHVYTGKRILSDSTRSLQENDIVLRNEKP